MRNYFTDYEFRLEVARRYPIMGRLVVLTVIFVVISAVPIAALWPLSTASIIVFGLSWLLGMAAGMGYYFVVERGQGGPRPKDSYEGSTSEAK